MIAKISTGRGARGALEYVLGEKKQERKAERDKEVERQKTEEAGRTHEGVSGDGLNRDERTKKESKREAEERQIGSGKERAPGVSNERLMEHNSERAAEIENAPAYRDGARARIIGGNLSGHNGRELAREFADFRALRPEVKNAVHHASISAQPGEKLTVEQWREIAGAYVREMGYERSCYVVVQHRDEPQEHVHIIASNITIDGKVVEQYRNYKQAEKIMRRVEERYDLRRVSPSHEVERRTPTRGEMEGFARTGEMSARMRLQDTVDRAMKGASAERPLTATAFVERLDKAGVKINPNVQGTGRVSGIVFERDGVAMKGSDLGKGYGWQGLIKRGLGYEPERDRAALMEAKLKYLEREQERTAGRSSMTEVFNRAEQMEELRAELTAQREVRQEPMLGVALGRGIDPVPVAHEEVPPERKYVPEMALTERDWIATSTPGVPRPLAELQQAMVGGLQPERGAANALNFTPELSGREALAEAMGYEQQRSAEELLREATAPRPLAEYTRDAAPEHTLPEDSLARTHAVMLEQSGPAQEQTKARELEPAHEQEHDMELDLSFDLGL